jgi:hypothetical protein
MLVRMIKQVTMFTNVLPSGNWRFTARIARVAAVSPWVHMSTVGLLSFLSSFDVLTSEKVK